MNSYDKVPYESVAHSQSHPNKLYVMGKLMGMNPKPVNQCKILEIGSSSGNNIIPLAYYYPDSKILGIDASEKQIQIGQDLLNELKLNNIELRNQNLMDFNEIEKFDYIICHGVFSWVPKEVQNKILDICSNNLEDDGIAYISYNTFPGWHMRCVAREMMLYHSRKFNDEKSKVDQSRAMLNFIYNSSQQNNVYNGLVKQEIDIIKNQNDSYVYHEHLEDVNEPMYFFQFNKMLENHNLKYLGESRAQLMVTSNFSKETQETLKAISNNELELEQYMDFVRNRMFRETLICKKNVNISRNIESSCVKDIHIAFSGTISEKNENNIKYKSKDSNYFDTSSDSINKSINRLIKAYPNSIKFEDLEPSEDLVNTILNLYINTDFVELYCNEIKINDGFSNLSKILAKRLSKIINCKHQVYNLNEIEKHIVLLSNKKTNDKTIVAEIIKLVKKGIIDIKKDGNPVEKDELKKIVNELVLNSLKNLKLAHCH